MSPRAPRPARWLPGGAFSYQDPLEVSQAGLCSNKHQRPAACVKRPLAAQEMLHKQLGSQKD